MREPPSMSNGPGAATPGPAPQHSCPSRLGNVRVGDDLGLTDRPALDVPVVPWRGRRRRRAVPVDAVPADRAGRPQIHAVVLLVADQVGHPVPGEIEVHLPLLPQLTFEIGARVPRGGTRTHWPARRD